MPIIIYIIYIIHHCFCLLLCTPQGFLGAANARGGSGGFAQVIANTAAAVTGLSAADFTNMAISGASVDRALTSGSAEIVISYDVTATPRQVSVATAQATYDLIKTRLEDAVSNSAFAKVRESRARGEGRTHRYIPLCSSGDEGDERYSRPFSEKKFCNSPPASSLSFFRRPWPKRPPLWVSPA